MALDSTTIEAIRRGCDIVAVVSASVRLRRSGRNHVGCCPFHAEKTPSFSVSADKQLFYCFGCHAGGDAFAFVMKLQGLDFGAAARQLAQDAGVALEPEAPEVRAARARAAAAAACNEAALAYFVGTLWSPQGSAARAYLAGREVPAAQARARRLGCGGSAAGLAAWLAERGHDGAAARDAGLLAPGSDAPLLAGRLVFPIHDSEGRLAGFGGRRLHDRAAGPKYVNSAEGPLFAKNRLLYGLEQARRAAPQRQQVLVVEGYTDVLAAQQAGLEEAVAALGTAFSAQHAGLCRRLARRAVVALDGDAAGQRASRGVCCLLLQAGMEVAVAALPPGSDPDSLLRRRGAGALRACVEAARPPIEHFMETALAPENNSVEARATAVRDLQPLLQALGSGLERDLYTSRLAARLGLSVEQLGRHLRPPPAARRRPAGGPPAAGERGPAAAGPGPEGEGPEGEASGGPAAAAASRPDADELRMLCELLLHPGLRARCGELAEFALTDAMRDILLALSQTPRDALEVMLERVNDAAWQARMRRIKTAPGDASDLANDHANRTFEDILAKLKRRHLDLALRRVLAELRETEARGDATDALVRRKQELAARKRALRGGRTAAE